MSRVLPILFNGAMVRAILDGRKTVTRRVVDVDISNQFDVEYDRKTVVAYIDQETGDSYAPTKMCRYQPGDILYVRESVFQGVGHYLDVSGETVCVLTNDFEYYADGLHEKDHWKDKYEHTWMHRRPSIHMPKEAARIWLKVKDVRVERLQCMSWDDICNEGIISDSNVRDDFSFRMLQNKFKNLWNSTIKKSELDRYGWDVDPWVWVISFERCEKPENW